MRSLGVAARRLSKGVLACLAAAVLACAAAPSPKTEKLGRLPDVVTKAEPEWLPFAIRAGVRAEGDLRERHLAELRCLTVEGDVARVAWSPDGRKLALEARMPADRASQVYVLDLGTGSLSRASNPEVESLAPSFWWPKGDRVIFAEASEGSSTSTATPRRIVAAGLDGGDPSELAADASFPAPLGDGTGLLFVGASGAKTGLFARALTPGQRPEVSPGESSTPVVTALEGQASDVATSPDRTRIAWIGRKKAAGALFAARIAPTRTGPGEAFTIEPARAIEALSTEVESIVAPAFLPDSHRLAFASDRDDAARAIYVVDLDERFGPGAPPRSTRVTYAAGGSEAAAFSPDGRHVAFVSRRIDHRASAGRRLFVARWVEDP